MAKGKITWNNDKDAELLVAILKVHEFKFDFAQVAIEMNTTASSIQHRLTRIKAKVKSGSTRASIDGNSSAANTPVKDTSAALTGSAGKPKALTWNNTARSQIVDQDDEENFEDYMTRATGKGIGRPRHNVLKTKHVESEDDDVGQDKMKKVTSKRIKREHSNESGGHGAAANRQLLREASQYDDEY